MVSKIPCAGEAGTQVEGEVTGVLRGSWKAPSETIKRRNRPNVVAVTVQRCQESDGLSELSEVGCFLYLLVLGLPCKRIDVGWDSLGSRRSALVSFPECSAREVSGYEAIAVPNIDVRFSTGILCGPNGNSGRTLGSQPILTVRKARDPQIAQ